MFDNSKPIEVYQPDFFSWTVRRVPNWCGETEIMFEINELDGCVSFGDNVKEAKQGLHEALHLWIKKNGAHLLPEVNDGCHLVYLEPNMSQDEVTYINSELQSLHEVSS
ncbi:hypothetical protein BTS2_1141 [Bacillus sp. TS-2]|nr:hypothetical protein BTS2_1141 [Bacillus sp. TS-2]